VLLVKDLSRYNPATYAGPLDTAGYDAEIARARAEGDLLFDIVIKTPWRRETGAETAYREVFTSIPNGLTFPFHALQRSRRLRDDRAGAHIRTEEYALFRTPGSRNGRTSCNSKSSACAAFATSSAQARLDRPADYPARVEGSDS
jgi:hypothetical protein